MNGVKLENWKLLRYPARVAIVAKVFVRICRSDERVAYMGAVSQRTQPMIYYIWRLFIVFMIMYLCHALKQFSEYGFYYFAS